MHYFTNDGHYGVVSSLSIIDTRNWHHVDWQNVNYAKGKQRLYVAQMIDLTKKMEENSVQD
jgi:hypothetical protein